MLYSPPPRPLSGKKLLTILSGFTIFFLLLSIRLYVLQISHAGSFSQLQKKESTLTIQHPSPRGIIYDRTSRVLALTRQIPSAFINRAALKDIAQTESFLADYYPEIYKEWQEKPTHNFFWLQRHIDLDQQQALQKKCSDISFLYEPTRWYEASYLSELIGTTTIDLQGANGIERSFNERLQGTPTILCLQKESSKSPFYYTQQIIDTGTPGGDISLSIDQHLSFFLSHELQKLTHSTDAIRACGVLMDGSNGQLLALTQTPQSQAIQKNFTVETCYEFGTLMTLFSGLAAFSEGITAPDELVDCEGTTAYIDGCKIHSDLSLGTVPFWQALAHGHTIGTAKICKRLGLSLYEHLARLGFSTHTGIELPHERNGFINPPERWTAASPLVLSFGYEVMATVMHIARALSVITHDGCMLTPTILLHKKALHTAQLYDKEPIRYIREMLEQAAKLHNLSVPHYKVLGQMGAARMLQNGVYSSDAQLFSCAGIVERGKYKRILVLMLEKPKNSTHSFEALAECFNKIATLTALHEDLCATHSAK